MSQTVKKVLLIALAAALVAGAGIGGTLALQ